MKPISREDLPEKDRASVLQTRCAFDHLEAVFGSETARAATRRDLQARGLLILVGSDRLENARARPGGRQVSPSLRTRGYLLEKGNGS